MSSTMGNVVTLFPDKKYRIFDLSYEKGRATYDKVRSITNGYLTVALKLNYNIIAVVDEDGLAKSLRVTMCRFTDGHPLVGPVSFCVQPKDPNEYWRPLANNETTRVVQMLSLLGYEKATSIDENT